MNNPSGENTGGTLLLALDAGGTKTALRLLDMAGDTINEVRVAGVANSYPGVLPVGQTLKDGLRQLTSHPEKISYVFGSVGGPNAPEVQAALEALLTGAVCIRIVRESTGAMQLPVAQEYGAPAVVLAGTGSVAFSRSNGRFLFAGGWGPVWDDKGSGGDLGRQGLRRWLREVDHRAQVSGLQEVFGSLSENLDVESYEGLLALQKRVLALSRSQVAAFAPALFELAWKGDEVALELVRQEAEELALLAAAVTPEPPRGGANGILGCGGLFQAGETFRQMCREALKVQRPGWRWLFIRDRSMLGPASRMVLEMAGVKDKELLSRMIGGYDE